MIFAFFSHIWTINISDNASSPSAVITRGLWIQAVCCPVAEQSPAWFWKLLSQALQPEVYSGAATCTLQTSKAKIHKDIQIALLHVCVMMVLCKQVCDFKNPFNRGLPCGVSCFLLSNILLPFAAVVFSRGKEMYC